MKSTKKESAWRITLTLSVVTSLFIMFIGCAAKQRIRINSEPPGAHVFFKNVVVATTPAVIELNKKEKNVILRLEKEGYKPIDVNLKRGYNGWYIPKLLAFSAGWFLTQVALKGNTKGSVIPAATGAVVGTSAGLFYGFSSGDAYKLNPKEVNVVMTELKKQGIELKDMSEDKVIVLDASSLER